MIRPGRAPRFLLRAACVAAPVWLAALAGAPAHHASDAPGHLLDLALDPAGNLYLIAARDSSIAVFAPGAQGRTAPVRRIRGPASGVIDPQGIALDSRGRIYTSNGARRLFKAGSGSVTVYPPDASGNVAPIRMIVGPRTTIDHPTSLALDPAGKIWVANRPNTVPAAFPAGADGDVEPVARLAAVPEQGKVFRDFSGTGDLAFGTDGSLLALDGRGLTAHLPGGPFRYAIGRQEDFMPDRPNLAVGPGGELYVVEVVSDSSGLLSFFRRKPAVHVYAAPESRDTVPVRTIAGPAAALGDINDIAVGRDGALYIVGSGDRSQGRAPRIAVYPPKAAGDVPPIRVIRGPRTRLSNATAIAVDGAGRIYVTNGGVTSDTLLPAPSVTVYAQDAAGDAAPVRTIAGPATRLGGPGAIAVADDGTVFVANADVLPEDLGSVTTHAAGAAGDAAPLEVLRGQRSGVVAPGSLAFSPGDTLYVALNPSFHPRINVYRPGATADTPPVRSLKVPWLGGAPGLAMDRSGRLYVAQAMSASGVNAYGPDLGAIKVYRPGAINDSGLVRTINGSATRLNGPSAVALDRSGNIYAANYWGTGPGSITVYGPGTEEDVRPLRMIAGPATGLKQPIALALDPHDTLYVANVATVTVYPPGATGDAAPVRTLEPDLAER
jgi:hypothetical protein